MSARTTQVLAEIDVSDETRNARASQSFAEIDVSNETRNVRVSQSIVEIELRVRTPFPFGGPLMVAFPVRARNPNATIPRLMSPTLASYELLPAVPLATPPPPPTEQATGSTDQSSPLPPEPETVSQRGKGNNKPKATPPGQAKKNK